MWDVHPCLEVLLEDGFGLERRVADVPELILERRGRWTPARDADGAWLVFDSDEEKRRLSPVPEDWETCPVDRLIEYWERTEFAPRLAS